MKKKTMLAGILSACVVGTASVLSLTGAAADKVYGDANLDGSVDMSDCVLVMQSLANPSKAPHCRRCRPCRRFRPRQRYHRQ